MLGVDPFTEAPFRAYVPRSGGSLELTAFLTRGTAQALGVGVGDSLDTTVEGVARRLRVVALLQPEDEGSARALESLVLTDLSTAQELLGQVGRLSRIDLKLPEGKAGEAQLSRLGPLLPEATEPTPGYFVDAAVNPAIPQGYTTIGYNSTDPIGDGEQLSSVGYVNLGGLAIKLAAGHNHACALMTTGKVRCWGNNSLGQPGLGNTAHVGDDETPANAIVNVAGPVSQLVAATSTPAPS